MDRMFLLAVLLMIMAIAIRLSHLECQCGIFLLDGNNSAGEEVYLGNTFPQPCEKLEMDQICRDHCYEKVMNITSNGNLSALSSELGSVSGQLFCHVLRRPIVRQEVVGYYRWCQTSWKHLGTTAHPSLCCHTQQYVRCEEAMNWTTVAPAVSGLQQLTTGAASSGGQDPTVSR